jgi:hypothetical protein
MPCVLEQEEADTVIVASDQYVFCLSIACLGRPDKFFIAYLVIYHILIITFLMPFVNGNFANHALGG